MPETRSTKRGAARTLRLVGVTALLGLVAGGAVLGHAPPAPLYWPELSFEDLCRASTVIALVTVDEALGVRAGPGGEAFRGYTVTVGHYLLDRTGSYSSWLEVWQATGREQGDGRLGLSPLLVPAGLAPRPLAPGEAYTLLLSPAPLEGLTGLPAYSLDHPGRTVAERCACWWGTWLRDVVLRHLAAPKSWSSVSWLPIDDLREYAWRQDYCGRFVGAAALVRVLEEVATPDEIRVGGWYSLWRCVVERDLAAGLPRGLPLVAGQELVFGVACRTAECPCNLMPLPVPGRRYVILPSPPRSVTGRWSWGGPMIGHPMGLYPVLEPDRVEVHWPILSNLETETPASIPLARLEELIRDALKAGPR